MYWSILHFLQEVWRWTFLLAVIQYEDRLRYCWRIEGLHKICKTQREETQMGGISAGVEGQDFTFLHILLLLKYELAWSTWPAYYVFCVKLQKAWISTWIVKSWSVNQWHILHKLLNSNHRYRRWGTVNQSFVLFMIVTASLDSLLSIIGQMHR